MLSEPLISIIIPTYNRVDFISETLQSLKNQTYKNWEAIIVDDGSGEETIESIKKNAQSDFRMKFYLRNRLPSGASVCRNIGVEKALGEYIIFLDSDDILAENCLAQRATCIQQNPKIDFGVFNAWSFKSNINNAQLHTKNLGAKNPLYHFAAAHSIWQTSCLFWKKTTVLKLNGFNENYSRFQDTEFHFRALSLDKVNYQVFADLQPDFYYRNNYEKRPSSFWNIVVENNFRFLNEVIASFKVKENKYLLRKSIIVLNVFGVVQCLRAEKKYVSEYVETLNSLQEKKIMEKKYVFFFKAILKLKQKGIFEINFLRKAIIRISYFLASKNINKISAFT